MTTKALIIGDVHLSDRAPTSRTATYKDDILDKLRFCVTKANELEVPIVQAGDMFHIKAPSKNSHRLVQETHEILKHAMEGVFIVPGNHDMQHDRLDSLDAQPLGALCRMSNIEMLVGNHPDLPGILGIPYHSFFEGDDWYVELFEWLANDIGNTESELIVAHAPIFPPGEAPGVYYSLAPESWATFWCEDGEATHTYYGHIHDCHGVFEVQGHTFCNQGALSRGSLHESSVNRKPAVTYWDGSEFTRIEVPHRPPEEVFLFATASEKAAIKASAADFADAVGKVAFQTLTLESVLASIKERAPDSRVLAVIEKALEEVQ